MLRLTVLSVTVLSATVFAQARDFGRFFGMSGSDSEATRFHVRVENVSTEAALVLSSGGTAAAPTAPVLWLVHTGRNPLFTPGQRDAGLGLESLAEDGSPTRLAESLQGAPGIVSVGTVTTPVGATEPGPILSGQAYEFEVSATVGERLTLAFMFGQSNDVFFAPEGNGMELFNDGEPVEADVTLELFLWDAGTEVNQEPGVGPDQAPRQAAENTGAAEEAPVLPLESINDGFSYPKVEDVVRVTIRPTAAN